MVNYISFVFGQSNMMQSNAVNKCQFKAFEDANEHINKKLFSEESSTFKCVELV